MQAFDARHQSMRNFKMKHKLPVFDKTFSEVALEYSDASTERAFRSRPNQRTNRWKIHTTGTFACTQLIPYVGHVQITLIGEDKWTEYPFWRKKNNAQRTPQKHPLHKSPKAQPQEVWEEEHRPAKDGTLRQEMITFRAIMKFAAKRKYIQITQVPDGDMPEETKRTRHASARGLHRDGIQTSPHLCSNQMDRQGRNVT